MKPSRENSIVTYDRPPIVVPATPGYILDVIRDWHRQQCQFDEEAEPDAELTFETTVAEWRSACDPLDWQRLGRGLDDEWGLGRPVAAWWSVLEPAEERTLRDVCEFIASGAARPSIEPVSILGARCLPAGAFLAIRSLLREAGVEVDSVTPSTPLGEYTRHHLGVFLGPISRLAPNALPAVKLSMPWYDLCSAGLLLGVLTAFTGWLISPLATAAGVTLALASWAGTWITVCCLPPSKVEFGSLQTFGDLARAVAEGAQADGAPLIRPPSPS
jgi:hypothetical protein